MKHLYPNDVISPAVLRLTIITLLFTCSSIAFSQTLNFNAPAIVSGTNLFSLNIMGSEMQSATLPVNLLNFTAQLVKDKVSLSWSSKQEDNISHYIIERSYNNETYNQVVALVFAAEASDQVNSYSFKDAVNTGTSVIYYRLKMVNKDGSCKLSEVRTIYIEMPGDNAKISLYPNPVTDNLTISIPQSWQNKAVTCQLLTINGLVIKSFTIQQAGQIASITMTEVPMGMYFVKAISGKESSTQPIIKSANR